MSNAAILANAPRVAAHPSGLTDVFDELDHSLNRDSAQEGVRLGVLLSAVGRRSYGPLLLIVGLFSISPATVVPGMTSFAALVTLLIAVQMALGATRPWLPKRVLDIRISRSSLFQFLDRARPIIDRIDGAWLRPRMTALTTPPAVIVVALCVVAAALITFPLSLIPFAPLAPGLAVVMFGLGMTARDGVWLGAGMALVGAALLIMVQIFI